MVEIIKSFQRERERETTAAAAAATRWTELSQTIWKTIHNTIQATAAIVPGTLVVCQCSAQFNGFFLFFIFLFFRQKWV